MCDESLAPLSGDNAYQAAQSFEELGLSVELLNGVKARGYVKPSKIQAQSLPYVLRGHNVIGQVYYHHADHERGCLTLVQAKHGSGKTAAYVLSMLSRVDETKACAQVRMYAQHTVEVYFGFGRQCAFARHASWLHKLPGKW